MTLEDMVKKESKKERIMSAKRGIDDLETLEQFNAYRETLIQGFGGEAKMSFIDTTPVKSDTDILGRKVPKEVKKHFYYRLAQSASMHAANNVLSGEEHIPANPNLFIIAARAYKLSGNKEKAKDAWRSYFNSVGEKISRAISPSQRVDLPDLSLLEESKLSRKEKQNYARAMMEHVIYHPGEKPEPWTDARYAARLTKFVPKAYATTMSSQIAQLFEQAGDRDSYQRAKQFYKKAHNTGLLSKAKK